MAQIDPKDDPKQIAIQMVEQMVGISDEDRANLLTLVKNVPPEKAEQAIGMIVETQKNLTRLNKEKNQKIKKRVNEIKEEKSQKDEEKEMAALDSELDSAFN